MSRTTVAAKVEAAAAAEVEATVAERDVFSALETQTRAAVRAAVREGGVMFRPVELEYLFPLQDAETLTFESASFHFEAVL